MNRIRLDKCLRRVEYRYPRDQPIRIRKSPPYLICSAAVNLPKRHCADLHRVASNRWLAFPAQPVTLGCIREIMAATQGEYKRESEMRLYGHVNWYTPFSADSFEVPHRPAPAQNHQQSDDDSDNGLLPCFSNTFPPPSLPRFRSMSPHELFCNRKRDLDEGIGNSSDTPLFSSDDLPASAEDYLAHRTKRQRKGPWWEHCSQGEPSIPRHKSKREFKRNMDSGVWMGSDSGVEEDSDLLDLNYTRSTETISDLALRTFEEPDRFDGPVFPYWEDQPPSPRYFWQNQKAAANQVRRGIDHEHHTFDLS